MRMLRSFRGSGLLSLAFCLLAARASTADFDVRPAQVQLFSPESSQQLLVTQQQPNRSSEDLTRAVSYRVLEPQIVSVDARGTVFPRAEGATTILVEFESESLHVPVSVSRFDQPEPISFEREILPILTKARCNSGGCHGKAEGQNGLKFSVFGFDPEADHAALVQESRGRRLLISSPAQSLVLLKGTAAVPHGGGRKIEAGSLPYRRLARWITEGAQYVQEPAAEIALEIQPSVRSMRAGETQQLQATIVEADGRRRCVTAEAEFESNLDSIAGVDAQGLIEAGDVPGEASILVRYRGQVAVCRVTHPRDGVDFVRPAEANFIDGLVWDKLKNLGISPSSPADEATFLRRVSLDTIGTLPTVDEARAFLADRSADKRERLIQQLLQRDEYNDYWTMRWADLLRVDQDRTQPEGAVAMTRWLHRQIAENRPYDEFVRELVTAQGNTHDEAGPAALFKVLDTPEALSRSFSQLFLGVRIECAQCHHHPFERWGQDDYYGLAGFLTGVSSKSLPQGGQAIFVKPGSDLQHPRTGKTIAARALGAAAADFTGIADRREVLAAWITSPDNPYFAKVIANRLWAHYFGRGLVEPIDDFRATNPATNEPLLTALEAHLRELRFDLRAFTRTLLHSQAYQLSAETNPTNAADLQNFSHATDRALPAEVLLDAISQVTGVPEKFSGWPRGYRAIQVWDNRMPSYFLRIFGRPLRVSVCECERSNEPSISQALHLMNSREIQSRIESEAGFAKRLSDSEKRPGKIVEELFLAMLSRFPSAEEQQLMQAEFERSDRRTAAEDILWTLMNTREFLYNH